MGGPNAVPFSFFFASVSVFFSLLFFLSLTFAQVLKMMTGDNLKDSQLQQIVDKTIMEADKNGDGMIDFDEVCLLLWSLFLFSRTPPSISPFSSSFISPFLHLHLCLVLSICGEDRHSLAAHAERCVTGTTGNQAIFLLSFPLFMFVLWSCLCAKNKNTGRNELQERKLRREREN